MKHLFFGLMIIGLISGCSTLRSNVRNDVNWAAYSSVKISVTEPDRWGLQPLLAERLADWGLMPIEQNQLSADLLATLEVTEGTSLAETGAMTTWPKNLLLRLHDRANGTELARSRYELAATQSPKHGLTLMVNDLRKQTRKTTDTAPAPQPQDNRTATTPTLPAPQATPAEPSAAPATTDSLRDAEPATATTPDATQAPGELSEPEPATSDWAPRFKGWQPWGDSTTAGESY